MEPNQKPQVNRGAWDWVVANKVPLLVIALLVAALLTVGTITNRLGY